MTTTDSPAETTARPLDGVRVVDLTRLLPGAYCTLVLADLGADVLKVEEPRVGDLVRTIPPYVDGTSVYFHALNRNKRSVTLDLRAREAAAVLDRLLDGADVLVESFRPRTAQRLGVSPAQVLPRHPRLVHCSLTGFGQTGPYSDRPAHDLNFVALTGLLEVDQPAAFHRPPPGARRGAGALRIPGLLVADIGGAWAAVAGIGTALFSRERTGRGCSVDISIHDVAASWLTFPAAARLIRPAAREGGRGLDEMPGEDGPPFPVTSGEACYNVYSTADGRYVALAAIEQKFWQTFCERTGHPEFTAQQFVAGVQERLREQVADLFGSRTLQQWLDLFADTDVCMTPVNSIREAATDAHLLARGTIVEHEGSKYLRSPIVMACAPDTRPGRSEGRGTVATARRLGADTDAVLRERGLSDEEVRELRTLGVV